jgi:hypothetical protein
MNAINGNAIAGANGDDPYTRPVPAFLMLPSASNISAGFTNTIIVIMILYIINAMTQRGNFILTYLLRKKNYANCNMMHQSSTSTLIVLCSIGVVFLILYALNNKHEQFSTAVSSSTNILVYTTMQMNVMDWLFNTYGFITTFRNLSPTTYPLFIQAVQSSNMSLIVPSNYKGKVTYVVDPYELNELNQALQGEGSYNVLATSPTGYFVGISSPYYTMECSFDFSNKTIGYFTNTDYMFIKSILHGYRIDMSTVRLKQLDFVKAVNSGTYTTFKGIDITITFLLLYSPLHMWLLTQNISFMGFKKLDVQRTRLFYPHISMASVNISQTLLNKNEKGIPTVATNAMVSKSESDTLLPSMKLYLVDIPTPNIEGFVSRLYLTPESLDPTYRCYGDVNVPSKALCDSPYDQYGAPKTMQTTWDRPCIKDNDCPFFQANTNYPNSRGGCGKGGNCEFPTGVLRKSFRKYNDVGTSKPFCYGCDAYDLSCCAQQREPDYAFDDDGAERQAAGLKTSIPMN